MELPDKEFAEHFVEGQKILSLTALILEESSRFFPEDFGNRGYRSFRMIFWAVLVIVPACAASPLLFGEF